MIILFPFFAFFLINILYFYLKYELKAYVVKFKEKKNILQPKGLSKFKLKFLYIFCQFFLFL